MRAFAIGLIAAVAVLMTAAYSEAGGYARARFVVQQAPVLAPPCAAAGACGAAAAFQPQFNPYLASGAAFQHQFSYSASSAGFAPVGYGAGVGFAPGFTPAYGYGAGVGFAPGFAFRRGLSIRAPGVRLRFFR